MPQIQITAGELESKKGELETLNKKLKEEIEKVSKINLSLRNDWEGESSDAYHENATLQVEKLIQGAEGVDQYNKALGNIIQEYKSTEARNVSIASAK